MSLRTEDYSYDLPKELIALRPPPARGDSRLMLIDRRHGSITHHHFRDLVDLITAEELLVLNNTRVIPARIRFQTRNAEIFLLRQIDNCTWRCLVRPGPWFIVGREFVEPRFRGEVTAIFENGNREIRFAEPLDLEQAGEMPLPPYIEREPDASDTERYQTVFASATGAVAAPTAGLHFSQEMLQQLPHAFITLHVGVGTFKPVKTDLITDHEMDAESFEIAPAVARRINEARKVLAVGTTTVRTLETLMQEQGEIVPGPGQTNIFIYPPFQFKRVDSLLTNFHLPRSTLLMLVSAFAGREFILEAYRQAVTERYRFFSYGDCMLIR
ncbi:MAG TPA: tRNA preQ1(34) S-adenosylmethionine ribosyltransferase-isomerase QueA [Chthoniobacterales bacterium]|nr:tRNA preQ1(34) S-adenosylmethionine ribosyltransferase-isomerase QueA [Chthoniobacterales bacterium]